MAIVNVVNMDPKYERMVRALIEMSDLSTITTRKLRSALEKALDEDLSSRKQEINQLIIKLFDEVAARNGIDLIEGQNDKSEKPAIAKIEITEYQDRKDTVEAVYETVNTNKDAKLAAELNAQWNLPRLSRCKRVKLKNSDESTKKKRREKKEAIGQTTKTIRNSNNPFNTPMWLSEELCILLGERQLSRPQVVKRLWSYIRQNDLQISHDRRYIKCDEKMKAVFGVEKVHMFTMNKLLMQRKQLISMEPDEIVEYFTKVEGMPQNDEIMSSS